MFGMMTATGWGLVVLDLASLEASAAQAGILADRGGMRCGSVGRVKAGIIDINLL